MVLSASFSSVVIYIYIYCLLMFNFSLSTDELHYYEMGLPTVTCID